MRVKPILLLGLCILVLLGGCGPETLPPDSTLARSQAQPAFEGTVTLEPTPNEVSEFEASTPIIETVVPLPEPTNVLTATTSEPAAVPIIPSLAITDPAQVDIYKIAEELVEAGDAAFPIQVTLGEGKETIRLKVSDPHRITPPCFPHKPAPYGNQYTCGLGGGMEAFDWIASWGEGLQRLLTDQAIGSPAWSPDGRRVAFATLRDRDERGDVPLMILDLESDEEIMVGRMSSHYQMAFTPDGNLVYLYDGQVHIVAMPQKLGDGVSIVKTIPLPDLMPRDGIAQTNAPWFKLSPDGARLAILREGFDPANSSGGLSILDLDSEQELLIEPGFQNYAGAISNVFDWSPQGNHLAYITVVEGEPVRDMPMEYSEIWVVDADGGNHRRVWRPDRAWLDYTALRWLPDGRAVLVTAAVESFADLVQIVSIRDGEHRDLVVGGAGINLFPHPGDTSVITGLMYGTLSPDLYYHLVVFTYE